MAYKDKAPVYPFFSLDKTKGFREVDQGKYEGCLHINDITPTKRVNETSLSFKVGSYKAGDEIELGREYLIELHKKAKYDDTTVYSYNLTSEEYYDPNGLLSIEGSYNDSEGKRHSFEIKYHLVLYYSAHGYSLQYSIDKAICKDDVTILPFATGQSIGYGKMFISFWG